MDIFNQRWRVSWRKISILLALVLANTGNGLAGLLHTSKGNWHNFSNLCLSSHPIPVVPSSLQSLEMTLQKTFNKVAPQGAESKDSTFLALDSEEDTADFLKSIKFLFNSEDPAELEYFQKEFMREVVPYLKKDQPLSKNEAFAIYLYTTRNYLRINQELRNGTGVADPYVNILKRALKKLPIYHGLCYRGTALTSSDLEKHQIGGNVYYKTCTSSSKLKDNSYSNYNHIFEVRSHSGRDISAFSTVFGEQEVLFAPNIKFKVVDRSEKGNGKIYFILEELFSPIMD